MNATQFQHLINSISSSFVPVIDSKYTREDYISIDLSTTNKALQHIDVSSSSSFQSYITNYLKAHKKNIAFGGYIETRDIYNRSTHFNKQDKTTQRNIHLGLDIWVAADTKVIAPLDGKVHSFQNNTNFGDYGPTIILEHYYNATVFYTLYGHLSLESINTLTVGKLFKKGDTLARLGNSTVNGDYAPHLHFQIIKDLEHNKGDYPGVSSTKTLEHYITNCPDPKLLLKLS